MGSSASSWNGRMSERATVWGIDFVDFSTG